MRKMITLNWLREHDVCQSAMEWIDEVLSDRKSMSWKKAVHFAFFHDHYNYANWLVSQLMTSAQCRLYSVLAAGLCEHVYNYDFPDDTRVRDCNITTRRYIGGVATFAELVSAAEAAEAACRSATTAAARSAAWSARSSARSVAAAEVAATTTDASWAADRSEEARVAAVSAAADAARADPSLQRTLIEYSIKLIEGGKK